MKKIWHFLKSHISQDFNTRHYLTIALLLVVAISLNYAFDFEDSVLDLLPGVSRFFGFFAFYTSLYFAAVSSYTIWYKKNGVFRDPLFWVSSLAGLLALSLDSSAPFLSPLIDQLFAPELHLWLFKVGINLLSFFTVFLPLLLFYFLVEKNDVTTYGLTPKKFDAAPYMTMLLVMFPILAGASFMQSFLNQYPMYRSNPAAAYLGIPEWMTVAGYELAYGLDFITVEFLFRGFFVIGMATFLGRGSVLTMAVIYCSLHFGKPMGEALSSIVGGYILGVIAYETKSIWGGIIVHVGIAWLMELLAFLQKL